jgi:hypothetical protein
MTEWRGRSGKFRCDECKRILDLLEDGGDDCGASHWFCYRCLEGMENKAAVIEARIERKHGVLPSSNAIFHLAQGS